MASFSASRRSSIGDDDWEDVGDDDLSVVSFPGSQDEKPAIGLADLPQHGSVLSGDLASDTRTTTSDDEASPRSNGKGKEVATDLELEEGHGRGHHRHHSDDLSSSAPSEDPMAMGQLYEPSDFKCLNLNPDHCQKDEDDRSSESQDIGPDYSQKGEEDHSSESQDIDLDALLRDIDSVRAILCDTIHSVEHWATLRRETSEKARNLCGQLAMQLEDLTPIVAGYARIWKHTATDIPLDPSLPSWVSGVRVKVLALQVELQDEVKLAPQAGSSVASTDGALHLIWEYLENCEQQMDDFLPIMQVDFDEFQTKQMSIPTAPGQHDTAATTAATSVPQPTAHIDGGRTYVPPRPTEQGPMLRAELYRLRDEIPPTMELLARISQRLPHWSAKGAQLATDIADQFQRVLSSLSTMLSNHGSEWIEQGLSGGGGLTYAEFSQLDADCVRDFAKQLGKTLAFLRDESRCLDLPCYGRTPAGYHFLGGPTPAVFSTLDQLEVLVQVLSATFGVEMALATK